MPVAPQVPVITFYSPNKADQGLIEIWNSETSAYVPLDEGQPHPNTRDYFGYKLGKQQNIPNSSGWIIRVWVKDETNPIWWNYAQKFLAESVAHPIFIRQFREPRKTYAPHTKSQPLTSVYKLTLVNSGTGYTPGTLPALTFDNTGHGGTGAAGHAIVNQDGTIADLVLDDGGSGYTSAPTFTVEAPVTGTTSTGTATIQSATALLVAEEAAQYPPDSEFFGLYLNVVRVYQTLPGPILNDKEYDQTWDIVVPSTRQVVAASAVNLATNRQEIKAIDSVQSEVRTFDPSALASVFDVYRLSFPSTVNLELPDVLTSLTAKTASATSDGTYDETASGSSSGTTYFYSVTAQGTAEGSASLSPELIVEIKQYWARNVPATEYFFFLPAPVTAAQVLARLATLLSANSGATGTVVFSLANPGVITFSTWNTTIPVEGSLISFTTTGALPAPLQPDLIYYVRNPSGSTAQLSTTPTGALISTLGSTQSGVHTGFGKTAGTINAWPKFIPQGHTFLLGGHKQSGQIRLRRHSQAQGSADGNASATSAGSGRSFENSTTIRSVRVPPTIHGAITISIASGWDGFVEFDVSASLFGGTVSDSFTGRASAFITPSSVSATTPSTIPTSGYYLHHSQVEPYRYGYARVSAQVINFADVT